MKKNYHRFILTESLFLMFTVLHPGFSFSQPDYRFKETPPADAEGS
jgi:hypothetical protein